MTQVKLYSKVAVDLFYEQVKWSIWFFFFVTAAHVIGLVIASKNNASIQGFFAFSTYSVAIFMLVCGIIAAYSFLGYYVQQGITRKDLYAGTVISTFFLALAVTLIPLALNGIEHLISTFVTLPIDANTYMIFDLATGWFSASGMFFLDIFTFYLIGWLIGIGYYRFGWLIGFGFIAIAMGALSLNSFFWTGSSMIPWIPFISIEVSITLATVGSLMLITLLLVAIRLLTKRIPIKM
ncbi:MULTISPECIES: hypothetical protein [Planococcus]|uniref:ABC transporter permease n=1 Tax=Planococcus faecalis TaxID=1598147 RepID=A0ABN4XKK1_9BACL|nr:MULTISPECIES: hypothetical protein [Planococcus]AQU78512.1 hypothetical protein AJGP001_04010 [Planococcus faecalis]MDJ0331524.1 hypothetical protein [Planococcus sp. S3-L1]OHX51486.1 hypothetical protein BB777_16755 [Planococcus faecalis]